MTILISFGQLHTHRINNVTIDKDCLAIVGDREQAFELFGDEFFTDYPMEKLDDESFMLNFPRGAFDFVSDDVPSIVTILDLVSDKFGGDRNPSKDARHFLKTVALFTTHILTSDVDGEREMLLNYTKSIREVAEELENYAKFHIAHDGRIPQIDRDTVNLRLLKTILVGDGYE